MNNKIRIGVIYPSDGVQDDEFWRCVPSSVTVHLTRAISSLDLPGGSDHSPETQTQIAESSYIEDAARLFSLIKPACVAYACTAVSFAKGITYDEMICNRIEAACGSPATTTSTAMVQALRALNLKRVVVAAPYLDKVCMRLRKFLEGSGLEVVSLVNLNLSGMAIGEVTSEEVYQLAKRANRAEAEGVFISCTALRTVEVLDTLERDLGKPVVSSNLATMWHALRLAGIHPQMDGLGSLYRIPPG